MDGQIFAQLMKIRSAADAAMMKSHFPSMSVPLSSEIDYQPFYLIPRDCTSLLIICLNPVVIFSSMLRYHSFKARQAMKLAFNPTILPPIFFILLGILLIANVCAADRRFVLEPEFPKKICATLLPLKDEGSDRQRIQAAIAHCPSGEAVRLTAGRFLSGPLLMRSGVYLWIDKRAVLAASTDPHDYDRGQGTCGTLGTPGNGCRPFITFNGNDGGGIVGDGVIDGQGGQPMTGSRESWWQLARRAQKEHSQQNVPRLIQLEQAKNLIFYRIRLVNSPNFHLAMNHVEGITVWGITIDTPATARNTDGIDPGAATDVTIAHTTISTGDDNVAIKGGSSGGSHFISLIDNHFYAGHGMSIGSETSSGVSDVLVRGLTLDGTTSGLRIKSDVSRGGLVKNVAFQDVILRNNRWPINFDTRYDPEAKGDLIPEYQNITLTHVSGGTGNLVMRGYDAAHPIGITLNGVRFDKSARWEIENTRVKVVGKGVFPEVTGGMQIQ